MEMTHSHKAYLPAAGQHWTLFLYDPITKLMGGDQARTALLDQAQLQPADRVLDLGCGTGTFSVQIKKRHPRVEVIGIDPDPAALARAQHKARQAALSITFDQGFADSLPYPDSTFDRVFSSFMYHHLEASDKDKIFREVLRILKPGGRLELADFGGPEFRSRSLIARLVHSNQRLADNAEDRVLARMNSAGLVNAKRVGERRTLMGHVLYYQALRPR